MDTIDIIKASSFIIDAQERDDGYVEAVYFNAQDEEELLFYESWLDVNDRPVQYGNSIPAGSIEAERLTPEMYRYDKNLKTWFHSRKTQLKFKKKDKNDE